MGTNLGRWTVLAALTFSSGLVGAPPAHAAPNDLQFKSCVVNHFTYVPCSDNPLFLCVLSLGTGQASHMGAVTVYFPHRFNTTNGEFSGEWTTSAANGDAFTMHVEGVCSSTSATECAIRANGVVVGGTGRFEGASGSAEATGTVDLVASTAEQCWRGTIALDR